MAGRDLVVVGLAYRSDEWVAFLEGEAANERFDVAAAVDPSDLREIEATVAGRTFRLSAVDLELAAGTSLGVQLGFFGPPSVKVIPPPNKQEGPMRSRARRPPERPWVHTLGYPWVQGPSQ